MRRGSRVQGQGPTNEPDHNPSGNGVFDAAENFRENFIFANGVKRHICDV